MNFSWSHSSCQLGNADMTYAVLTELQTYLNLNMGCQECITSDQAIQIYGSERSDG